MLPVEANVLRRVRNAASMAIRFLHCLRHSKVWPARES